MSAAEKYRGQNRAFQCSPLQLKTPWCASAVSFNPVPINPWYALQSPNKHPVRCQSSLLLPTLNHHFDQLRIYKLPPRLNN